MSGEMFLIAHAGHTIASHEHILWYGQNSRGYTICIDKAGRYTKDEAIDICVRSECIAVPENAIVDLAKTTPYYRRANGTLNKLYDGDSHRPVENSKQAWRQIQQIALIVGAYAKPTPIAQSKMRSIYTEQP